MNLQVIAIVGTIASGKSTVAEYLQNQGYVIYKYSQILTELLENRKQPITRESLQNLGDWYRKNYHAGILSELLHQKIHKDNVKKIVVDGVRNPAEITTLKRLIPEARVIGVDAPLELRIQRVFKRSRVGDSKSYSEIKNDLKRDLGIGQPDTGQQTKKSLNLCDFVLINANSEQSLEILLKTTL